MNKTNHARKTPTPGRARKLFIRHPFHRDVEWAALWDVSPERVRQIRVEAGVPTTQRIAANARDFVRYWRPGDE